MDLGGLNELVHSSLHLRRFSFYIRRGSLDVDEKITGNLGQLCTNFLSC